LQTLQLIDDKSLMTFQTLNNKFKWNTHSSSRAIFSASNFCSCSCCTILQSCLHKQRHDKKEQKKWKKKTTQTFIILVDNCQTQDGIGLQIELYLGIDL
jgi:hypothetical protein